MARNVKDTFYSLIKTWEGYKLQAYQDIKGIWTIGMGTITYPDGSPVKQGDTCTAQEAAEYLEHHVAGMINTLDKTLPASLSQNQFDACASLAYNIGLPAFLTSTVRKRVCADPLAFQSITDAFLMWNKARIGGQLVYSDGLNNRRIAEAKIYCGKA